MDGASRLVMHDSDTVFTDLRVEASVVRQMVAKMSEKAFGGAEELDVWRWQFEGCGRNLVAVAAPSGGPR